MLKDGLLSTLHLRESDNNRLWQVAVDAQAATVTRVDQNPEQPLHTGDWLAILDGLFNIYPEVEQIEVRHAETVPQVLLNTSVLLAYLDLPLFFPGRPAYLTHCGRTAGRPYPADSQPGQIRIRQSEGVRLAPQTGVVGHAVARTLFLGCALVAPQRYRADFPHVRKRNETD